MDLPTEMRFPVIHGSFQVKGEGDFELAPRSFMKKNLHCNLFFVRRSSNHSIKFYVEKKKRKDKKYSLFFFVFQFVFYKVHLLRSQ